MNSVQIKRHQLLISHIETEYQNIINKTKGGQNKTTEDYFMSNQNCLIDMDSKHNIVTLDDKNVLILNDKNGVLLTSSPTPGQYFKYVDSDMIEVLYDDEDDMYTIYVHHDDNIEQSIENYTSHFKNKIEKGGGDVQSIDIIKQELINVSYVCTDNIEGFNEFVNVHVIHHDNQFFAHTNRKYIFCTDKPFNDPHVYLEDSDMYIMLHTCADFKRTLEHLKKTGLQKHNLVIDISLDENIFDKINLAIDKNIENHTVMVVDDKNMVVDDDGVAVGDDDDETNKMIDDIIKQYGEGSLNIDEDNDDGNVMMVIPIFMTSEI